MTLPGHSTPPDMPAALAAFVNVVERSVNGVSRHWLGVANLLFLLYVGLPFLAPVLMHVGAEAPARIIYLVYRQACHQLPERSYFLFGDSPIYSLDTLPQEGVANAGLFVRRSYIGDAEHGYKVAICERDVAIYGAMFLMGLLFALRRQRMKALDWRLYLLFFVLPMAVDGLTQLVGLRSSDWLLRTITGALFGIGTVWFVYPYLAQTLRNAPPGNHRSA